VQKFELDDGHKEQVMKALLKRGDAWMADLKDLDHSLSKARNPSSLLTVKLNDLDKLNVLVSRAQKGHLPGCMCSSCKEAAFSRAVGVDKQAATSEAASLNALSLAAYQMTMDIGGGPPVEEEDSFLKAKKQDAMKGRGKSKGGPLVLPTGDLVTEVRAFCHRYSIDERLQTRVMDALKKRTDEEWRQDLADMNKALSSARNPSGMLCVKLGDLDKLTNPNQLCFNYRAGTCTFGMRCRYSHDATAGVRDAGVLATGGVFAALQDGSTKNLRERSRSRSGGRI